MNPVRLPIFCLACLFMIKAGMAQPVSFLTADRLCRELPLYLLTHYPEPASNGAVAGKTVQKGISSLGEGRYGKAASAFSEALYEHKSLNNPRQIVVTATLAALACWLNNENEKALQYLYNAHDLSRDNQITDIEPVISALLGSVYLSKGDTTLGRSFMSDAWKKHKRAEGKIMALLFEAAGEAALLQNQTRIALIYFNQQLRLIPPDDYDARASAILNAAIACFRKGDFDESVNLIEQSLRLRISLPAYRLKKDALLKAASLYSFKGDFTKADSCHLRYRNVKDTLEKHMGDLKQARFSKQIQQEQQRIIRLINTEPQPVSRIIQQHDLELSRQMTATEIERQIKENALEELNVALIEKKEKERELLQLLKAKAEQDLELSRQTLELEKAKRTVSLLVAAAVLILAFAFFLFNRYRFKKKANAELQNALDKLKAAQDQLVHAQKMASFGELTAGIAHELQNPLNFVNNFSELSVDLLDELVNANPEQQKEIISQIKTALLKVEEHGKRASNIIKNMLMHSRHPSSEKQPVSLNQLVESAVSLAVTGYHSTHPEFKFRLIENYDKVSPIVNVFHQDISRVVINLITNALQAMTENLKKGFEFEPELVITTSNDKSEATVSVCNSGPGIPAEIQDKIFQPFFTTKSPGSGTGLGLSISYDIITKGHGGKLFFTSDSNRTCFIFTLPYQN